MPPGGPARRRRTPVTRAQTHAGVAADPKAAAEGSRAAGESRKAQLAARASKMIRKAPDFFGAKKTPTVRG
eukprot:329207-Pyramimonas_sp.AAC.1